MGQLGNDPFTIKEIAATSHLNRTIWENFHGLGTVTVMVRKGHLIVESCWFQFPFKPRSTFGTNAFQLV